MAPLPGPIHSPDAPPIRLRGSLPPDIELIPSDLPPVTPARSKARPSSAMRARATTLSSGFDRPVIAPLPELLPEPVARPRLVGIGASAGGLESLRLLLPTLPGDRGLTYVVLQHLAPTHRSMLAEILSQRSLMPVRRRCRGRRSTCSSARWPNAWGRGPSG
jgi:chemotaxis response regulator CheB